MNAYLPAWHGSPVTFLSPENLWLLLIVPLAVALYLLLLRRRRKAAVRYGHFGMLKQAVGTSGRLRRHLPPILFLAALTLMILGIARPAAVMRVASHKSTVILAMDVSGSMSATDIKPTRIEAMQRAAKAFIEQQPRGVDVGIVAFAGSAFLVQPPTGDHTSLDAAIDRFELQPRTAVGAGILASLAALFPKENFGVDPFNAGGNGFDRFDRFHRFGGLNGFGGQDHGTPLGEPPKPSGHRRVPVPPGSDKSALIILLTDGATNAGPDPIYAAHQAADHGVRVYTVGFGTDHGEIVGYGGWRMRAELDEAPLKQIAAITHGRYFRASSAADLRAVYRLLSKSVVVETKEVEITSLLAAVAAALALASGGLSVLWFSRVL
ncbi:MAG: VWA domain-containing protein [Steroidobacteraceae bacterium]